MFGKSRKKIMGYAYKVTPISCTNATKYQTLNEINAISDTFYSIGLISRLPDLHIH